MPWGSAVRRMRGVTTHRHRRPTLFRHIPTRFGARLLVALLALGLLTGGTATAAKLITGKSVKNGSLTGADLKNGSVASADLKNGSIRPADLSSTLKRSLAKAGATGAAGKAGPAGPKGDAGPQGPAGTPNGYTKDEANAAFLGKSAKANDAEQLDGVDGDDYVAGDAGIRWAAITRQLNTPDATLATIPGLGRLEASCGNGGTKTIEFENLSGGDVEVTRTMVKEGETSSIYRTTVAPNTQPSLATSQGIYEATIQLLSGPESGLAAARFATVNVTAFDFGGPCSYRAQIIENERDVTPLVANP